MSEALTCAKCGLSSEFTEAYIQQRRPFRSSKQAWCPACWSRKQNKAGLWWYAAGLALGLIGLLLYVLQPGNSAGLFLTLLCLFQIFLVATIVPHELGHAWAARLLGWRVFRIIVGVGTSLGKRRWGGFEFEWKPIPMGGVTLVAPVETRWFRIKLFLIVLSGLLVNVMLGASMLLFYPWEAGAAFHLDQLPTIPKVFLFANAFVLATNLWPTTWTNLGVKISSDGKQLMQSFVLKKETVADRHADYYTMEAMERLTQRDFAGAERWTQAGLALYPKNINLLNTTALTALQQDKLEGAR